MRIFWLALFVLLTTSLHAQFKGIYSIVQENDSVKLLEVHSDGEFLMERISMGDFGYMTYYIDLKNLESDDHILVTTVNTTSFSEDTDTTSAGASSFYTKAHIHEFSSHNQKATSGLKTFKDTLGCDLIKIYEKNNTQHLCFHFMNTDHKIIGLMFGSDELIPVPKTLTIEGAGSNSGELKLVEFKETNEKTSVPREEELGTFIEFEQYDEMMNLNRLGKE